MLEGLPASGPASARIFSSDSVSVCAARRAISSRYIRYTASRGSDAMSFSSVALSARRTSGSMNAAAELNAVVSCTISCRMP